jgi:hypothetical protein
MWLKNLYQRWVGRSEQGRRARPQPRRRGPRLALERLEDRTVPASFTAASVAELVADINAANLAGGANTITLAPGAAFTLTAADNTTDGANGLPVIAAGDDLTIQGNGAVIERSTAAGTPPFRLFDVTAGASLTLANLTLQGGLAYGEWVAAQGGAVYNQGALTLDGVTVQNNIAQGTPGEPAVGGGIWSGGALTLEGNTRVLNNQALGGAMDYYSSAGAYGGGVCVVAGTATLTDVTVSGNAARAGRGAFSYSDGWTVYFGTAASGYGGGLDVGGGTATLTRVTVSGNTAQGGAGNPANSGQGAYGGYGGSGYGGGVYVGSGGATLTSVSVLSNTARGGDGGAGFVEAGEGGDGFGGGLYVGSGTAALASVTLSANTAQGGKGGYWCASGGSGYGGGVYVDSGAAMLTGVTLSSNTAQGGAGGDSGSQYVSGGRGGYGLGGGLYAAGGTVELHEDSVTGNYALGGAGGAAPTGRKKKSASASNGTPGLGEGGGLYLGAAAVCLDAFTQAHVTTNHASTLDPDIHGQWKLC